MPNKYKKWYARINHEKDILFDFLLLKGLHQEACEYLKEELKKESK